MGHWVVSVWFSFSDDPSQEQEEGRKDLLILMEPAAVFTSVYLKLCPVSVLGPGALCVREDVGSLRIGTLLLGFVLILKMHVNDIRAAIHLHLWYVANT